MHIKQIQHSVASTVEDEKVKVVKMDRNQTEKSRTDCSILADSTMFLAILLAPVRFLTLLKFDPIWTSLISFGQV